MRGLPLRGKYGFLIIAVLSLLFLLVILTSVLVVSGQGARKYVLEAQIANEEEQAISESHVHWQDEIDNGTYTQQNPWPKSEYTVNPMLDTSFKMKARFSKNESYNRPFPDTPGKNADKVPSIGFYKTNDAEEIGYKNTWVPPWHCYIALESTKKKRHLAMYSAAFPYGIYAPNGSVDLSSARSFTNPMVDSAKEGGWAEDLNRAGLPVNIIAHDDITVDDYPHGYAYTRNGKITINQKNGAIGLKLGDLKRDYSLRFEQDILNAYDKIAGVTMNKTHYLKGVPLEYGLFVGIIYSTVSTIVDPKSSQFASIMSLEQAQDFPFLVIFSIKERFGGMIWQMFCNYPDTVDRIMPDPESDEYAKEMAKYEQVQLLMNGAAALDYCWCNPGIDPTEEDDWQKRYLKLDQVCPPGSAYGDAEFMAREDGLNEQILKVLIDKGHDSKYESHLEGFAIKRHNWTRDDLKDIQGFLKDKNMVVVYRSDSTSKYKVTYKDSNDKKHKEDYIYPINNIEVRVSWNDVDDLSQKDLNSKMKKEALSRGKDATDDAKAQYEKDTGRKASDIDDPGDTDDVTITTPVAEYSGQPSIKKEELYNDDCYDHHKKDIWPGKTALDEAWGHLNNDARKKNQWFDPDNNTLFDREFYVKYGFLLDVQGYAEDEDFPDKPDDSRYDEMSLLTERKYVPYHGDEPYDKFGIRGCNYGKLFFHFFRGLFKAFDDFGDAITDGDPMKFFEGFEQMFEEQRRLVHFRGKKADMTTDDSSVTIVSDWTVPRGRTLKLECNLGVVGDIWIQDGATLCIKGDLMVCNPDKLKEASGNKSSSSYLKSQMKSGSSSLINMLSSSSGSSSSSNSDSKTTSTTEKPEVIFANAQIKEMNKGKKEYFKPTGRIFLGKGANLLVGGKLFCMGTPEKGSILIDSPLESVNYVTSSIICKGDVIIPYSILPGISPNNLGAYLEKNGLKEWNTFLRDIEVVPSQVGKVIGPIETRLCCFAQYPDPVTILNLTDFGLPVAIPFPTFFSTRTNENIGIFKGLGLLYTIVLNGVLGENLYTDTRWWALLREDELYSESKTPKKEDVEEYFYSKESEEAYGGVPMVPKFGSRKSLEDLANVFKTKDFDLPDMKKYEQHAHNCLCITISEKLLEKTIAKVFEEVLVKLFEEVFEGTEFLKDLGERGFEWISEWFAEELFSGGKIDKYMEEQQECNPAAAVMKLGIAFNIYMKTKMSELSDILSKEKPDNLIHETSGVLVYGESIKIGTADQNSGECIFAPGLFVAHKDIESYAERTIGCMISVNGNITARNFQYYPYFTRASLNVPLKYNKPLWEYIVEFWKSDAVKFESTENPIEIGKTILHVVGEGWDR
ncbi:MAG: hypothetical protein LWY06_00770 [Firmicutes bacterium]|nr:hypothetical protein [Bacillota bacterium]